MKKLLQILFHRAVVGAVLMLLQLAVLILMLLQFERYFVYFYAICILISACVSLYIINNRSNPAYKIAWLIPILLVPLFGGVLYLLFGRVKMSRRQKQKMAGISADISNMIQKHPQVFEKIRQENVVAGMQSKYLRDYAFAAPYENTSVEYFPLGEAKFERMLQELKAQLG